MAPRPPTVVASRETRDAPRKRWHPSIPKEDVMRLVASLVIALLMLAAAGPGAAQQGVTDAEIVLGCSNSFSGPLAYTGEQATRFGVDLYLKVVNDAGGINGRKVRTVYYDDGFKPQEAVANTRKLVEQDKVFAVIAPQGTAPVSATLEYLEENKVPLLFPFQGSPITRGKKYVFSGMTLYDRQSKMMIDYLVGQRKVKPSGAAMQRYFDKNEPNRYSLSGYFAAVLFVEGARRAGRTLTRETLIGALENVKNFDSGILPPLTIGPDHETQKQGFWVRVEKGRFKPLTDWLRSD